MSIEEKAVQIVVTAEVITVAIYRREWLPSSGGNGETQR